MFDEGSVTVSRATASSSVETTAMLNACADGAGDDTMGMLGLPETTSTTFGTTFGVHAGGNDNGGGT